MSCQFVSTSATNQESFKYNQDIVKFYLDIQIKRIRLY